MISDHSVDRSESTEYPRLAFSALWWLLGFVGFLALVTVVAFVVVQVKKSFGIKSPNLQVAAVHYPQDIVPLIRNGHDVNAVVTGQTPLNHAVTFRKVNSVRLLLKHGADPNVCGSDGKPPLASPFLSSYDVPAIRQIVDLLLDAGADPNVHGVFGETPLHKAIQVEDLGLAHRLISLGADPNAVDELRQQSAMHLVAENGDLRLFHELLAAGGDVNLQKRHGMTPLMIAVQHANEPLVEAILQAGADVSLTGWSDKYIDGRAGTPRIREILREHRSAGSATQP